MLLFAHFSEQLARLLNIPQNCETLRELARKLSLAAFIWLWSVLKADFIRNECWVVRQILFGNQHRTCRQILDISQLNLHKM